MEPMHADAGGRATTAADVLAAARVLRAAGGALWDQARLHGELARIEWIAERRRLARCAALAVLGGILLGCALAAGGALVVLVAWDTPLQWPVVVLLPFVYAGLAALALARLRRESARAGGAFAATREEFAADLALLRSRL